MSKPRAPRQAPSKSVPRWTKTILACACLAAWSAGTGLNAIAAEPQAFTVAQSPLFLNSPLPNVMFLLDNSNSFDERADGVPVGSNHNTSKSIIARTALRNIVENYQGQINLGLMAYKQGSLDTNNVAPAIYDAGYDPSTYDPTYTDADALANGWEAFPFRAWASTPYTGVYNTPMPCAAPYACPWPAGQAQPYLYTGLTWADTTATRGERRNKKVQYRNFSNTSPWWQHPYDFMYYNLMQASYSGSFVSRNPPGGAFPPPAFFCYSTNTFSLHGKAPGAPAGIGGNTYNCRWGKSSPLAGQKPDMTHNGNGTATLSGSSESNYGFGGTGFNMNLGATDSDQAQGLSTFGRSIVDFGNTLASSLDTPSAPAYYQADAVGYGAVKSVIAPLNAAKVTALNNLLQCRIPTAWAGGGVYNPPPNTTACANTGINNAGATPSPGSLQTALRYFQGSLTANENETGVSLTTLNTTGAGANNLPVSCGKNYVIFFTDGMPTHKPDGSMYATPAAALADTVTAAANLKNAGVMVYVIGFGNAVQSDGLNQIAEAGGTDVAFVSSDAETLNATLSAVFADIIVRSASAASVATNSAQFSVDSSIFQARFTSADWSGQLLKYQTDNANGAVAAIPDWDAGQMLNAQAWQSTSGAADRRQIITAAAPNDGDMLTAPVGVPFAWPANPLLPKASELRLWQTSALNRDQNNLLDGRGAQRLDWLRGSRAAEGTAAPALRRRAASVLGDIANSYPLYIGAPASSLASGSAYYDFKTAYKNRPAVVAASSNDGMMHLFDAATGKERFAYVPSNGYRSNASAIGAARLSQPMRQDYKTSHLYIADGSPVSEDVFYGGAWHTVLAAGTGAGGSLVYALNISNIGNDSAMDDPALTEANASSLLLWEFTDKNYGLGVLDANGNPTGVVNGDPDMGYAFSKPLITQANNGKWVAIFGNGYNNRVGDTSVSTTGRGALYVVDISNGNLIRKVSVPVGTTTIANGLGSPRGLDENLDGKTDTVYAGDLYGNVWKFDLSASSPSSWNIAYSGNPLFTVDNVGANGNRRPITGELRVTPNPSGGYMVLFGTGRYLGTSPTDLPSSYDATTTDALYSIWDSGVRIANGRSWLRGQTLQNTTSSGGVTYRQLTNNATTTCGYGATPSGSNNCTMGCYVDLTGYPNAGNNGERFTFFPQLSSGSASFNTIIPSTNVCSAGGDSQQVIFNYLTCSADTFSPFDVNNDNSFTSADLLPFGGAANLAPAGSKILSGITPPGTRVYNNANGQIYVYNSSSLGGQPTRDKLRFNGKGGRVSWRPLPKNPKH
jgi:type IV pilus assembly protein PilY1